MTLDFGQNIFRKNVSFDVYRYKKNPPCHINVAKFRGVDLTVEPISIRNDKVIITFGVIEMWVQHSYTHTHTHGRALMTRYWRETQPTIPWIIKFARCFILSTHKFVLEGERHILRVEKKTDFFSSNSDMNIVLIEFRLIWDDLIIGYSPQYPKRHSTPQSIHNAQFGNFQFGLHFVVDVVVVNSVVVVRL